MSNTNAPIELISEVAIKDAADEIAAYIARVASSFFDVDGLEARLDEYIKTLPAEEREVTRASAQQSLARLLAQKALEMLDSRHAEVVYSSFAKG